MVGMLLVLVCMLCCVMFIEYQIWDFDFDPSGISLAIIILEMLVVLVVCVLVLWLVNGMITVSSFIYLGISPSPISNVSSPRIVVRCETRSELVVTPSCHGCRIRCGHRPAQHRRNTTIQYCFKGPIKKIPLPIAALNQPHRKKKKQQDKHRIMSHAFFVPLTTSPRTLLQSISLSIPSSTSPQTTTLSPRIRYSPCSICELGSGSSGVRIMRSMVSSKTRFVS